MKAYLAKLKSDAGEVSSQREAVNAKIKGADTRILCDKPLTDQIQELMLSLPAAQRNQLWSMGHFVALLQGRFSARPHTMNVGQALRALGWRRQRIYARGGGGCRYWVPPLDGAA